MAIQPTPPPELAQPDAAALAQEASTQLERIQSHEISDDLGEEFVANYLLNRKARRDYIDDAFKSLLSTTYAAWQEAHNLKRLATEPIDRSIELAKRKIADYRRRKAEAAEAESRRQREEIERRHAEKVEATALEAERNGATAAEVKAIISQPNFYEGYRAPEPSRKIKGINSMPSWSVSITDKRQFVEAALRDPTMFAFVEVNVNKVAAQVRLLKGQLRFPGVQIQSDLDIRASAKHIR